MPGSESDGQRDLQRRSCLDSAARWRQEAENLRSHAALPRLAPEAGAALRREADAADRQAAWWEAGAEDHQS